MKKILAISVAAAMLLAVGATAFASATNWTITVKASDTSNMNYNTALTIGTGSVYTDGVDATKGEPGSFASTPLNKTLATAATWIDGAAKAGFVDQKASITNNATKSWDIHFYLADNGGPGMATMKALFTLGTSTYAPVYNFGGTDYEYVFTGSMVPNGQVKYDKNNMMPASFNYTFSTAGMSDYASGAVLNVTVRPIVPEPSSIVAMLSGLAGMAGFAIRRRK